MDTQARHEEQILKLRQDVRELKALNRRSVWIGLFVYPLFVLLMIGLTRNPKDEGMRIESGEVDVVTTIGQNRLSMSTLYGDLELSNLGRPQLILSDKGDRFVLTIEDGKLVAMTHGKDGKMISSVLMDGVP